MGVYFVVDQVVQFQVVYVVDGGVVIECFIGVVVIQLGLVVQWQVGEFEYVFDFGFGCIVEYWGGYWYVIGQVVGQMQQFFIVEL